MLYDGYGDGVCYIVNDLTNRELIRRNFKFEHFSLKEDDVVKMSQAYLDNIEEDMIIEGSTVFNSDGDLAFGPGSYNGQNSTSRINHEYVPRNSKKIESKDLTAEAEVFKNKKGKYFQCKFWSMNKI
jgi:hypothetical protein